MSPGTPAEILARMNKEARAAIPEAGRVEGPFQDSTASAIDEEVRAIVDKAMERAAGVLERRRDTLERTARRLLEVETLDANELATLVGPSDAPSLRRATG